jgi:alpha-N-arabinofuranosidase
MKRRQFLQRTAFAAGAAALTQIRAIAAEQTAAAKSSGAGIVIDPVPQFELSAYLNMQFMEPLGVTDSSVEAAWDYNRDDWREDFIKVSRELGPGMMRYGGLFSRYYKWREGIGPADKRPSMRNYIWGGKETNRVGTHEFVDFCRRIKSEPFYCVNFLSDGEKRYASAREGNRTGDAQEAADWVSYANDPDHAERKSHGHAEPYALKIWQLGNETSYGGKNTFNKDESIAATISFAKAMRSRDSSIQLIGWGDNDWAPDLLERAGEHLQYIAIHMMNQSPVRKETVLRGLKYQSAPEQAWQELMDMIPERLEKKLVHLENSIPKSNVGIAITEGHVSFAPHNSNPILLEWLMGVYHARVMNLYQRHGNRVKIATIADFNGTRWTNCAVLHQVPSGVSYLTPAGAVARLLKPLPHEQSVRVESAPADLDIAASRVENKIRLRVANMSYSGSTDATFALKDVAIVSGRISQISPDNPRQEVSPLNPGVFAPRESNLASPFRHRFPARSVTLVELETTNG